MTRAEFVSFVQATFNAMDMITPAEGATAVLKAFDELDAALRAGAEAPQEHPGLKTPITPGLNPGLKVGAEAPPPTAISQAELILIRECVRSLDCGVHYCRYCSTGSAEGWTHFEHCPYEDSVKKVEEARAILDRLQRGVGERAPSREREALLDIQSVALAGSRDTSDLQARLIHIVDLCGEALRAEALAPAPDKGETMELPDIEVVAAKVHEAWMETKRAQGIVSRPAADGTEQMVPYADLPDALQELDRATVRAVYAAIEASAK